MNLLWIWKWMNYIWLKIELDDDDDEIEVMNERCKFGGIWVERRVWKGRCNVSVGKWKAKEKWRERKGRRGLMELW